MKILLIGQLPPPYNGQSMQIERIKNVLEKYDFDFKFIKLDFSEDSKSIGSFSIGKVFILLKILFKICYHLLWYRPDYIHYPPAGPNKTPMLRDMVLLFPVRFFKFRIIFRFHAGGISGLYKELNPLLKFWYSFTYFHVDYATCMSKAGMDDPVFLHAKNIKIIPNGVKDSYRGDLKVLPKNTEFIVLFIGLCIPSKGILDFIEIIKSAHQINSSVRGRVIGDVIDESVSSKIKEAENLGLLQYEGIKIGEEKTNLIRSSDVLLFPTYYESENFPTVILEAFSFGMPVVSTDWRGVKDQIIPGYNGFIHPVHNITTMRDSIVKLSNDRELCDRMGENARKDYLEKYTLDKFEDNFRHFFSHLK